MPSIEQWFRDAIAKGVTGDRDARITLEAINDSSKWVQLSWDAINAAYPVAEQPAETLARLCIALPDSVDISDWQANGYITFEHGAEPLLDLVRFVGEYLAKVLHIATPEETLRVVADTP